MPAFVRTTGAALLGADAVLVDVQVSVTLSSEGGERVFRIVGLPDSALREGRERIRAAVTHGGHPGLSVRARRRRPWRWLPGPPPAQAAPNRA